MKKIKKVYKYGTGHPIPEGAVYLCTKVQRKIEITGELDRKIDREWVNCWLVWHYFLVEIKEE